jgi:outer membrane protein assembly factor BamB
MMGSVLRLTVLGLVALAALSPFAAPSTSKRAAAKPNPNQNWLSYGHDGQLTNYLNPGLNAAAARRLRQVWTKKLDGGIVASPLYVSGSTATARMKDTLIVATESGSVYALRPTNGTVLWTRKFGVVDSEASCGPWGISSTGAIDLKRGVVYVISADGWLHALDLRTGAERRGWPISITADEDEIEYVWGGLRLLRNTLYVPVASYCDVGDDEDEEEDEEEFANGRLVAVDVDQAAQTAVFDPVRGDDNLGGIWGWGGAAIDPAGQFLFTGVGNSHTFDEDCNCIVDDAGYGDSVVKLRPDLRVSAAGRPAGYPSTGDLDFGSAPLLFQPPGCPPLAAANSKIGAVFVWNRNAMAAGPVANIPVGGGYAFVGQPSYSPALRMIYVAGENLPWVTPRVGDGVAAFSVDKRCRFHLQWRTNVGSGPAPPPLVLGDVVIAAGGFGGGYAAIAARTGKALWRFRTSAAALAPVIAAKGRVYAGDFGGTLRVFAPKGPD